MKPAGGADRAVKIQRKIFTRWVNQKLARRNIQVDDIVTAVHDGVVLIALMEVVSEKRYTGKPLKTSAMRVQKIDNVNNALNFVWNCGVQTKIKPSAENLVDGTDKPILGLIFAIMEKFVKHVDEDGDKSLNMRDALMKWVQTQLIDYPDIKIENFTSSFQNGLALCALIHKHRSEYIDFDKLPKGDNLKVVAIALDAAEKAFGMEKFLTPEEVLCLDESSMLVYLGEYYFGIAQWKKYGMAASRISKLIKTTKLHDDLKTQYNDKAVGLIKWIDAALVYLSDRSIDFTLSGAQQRLKDFYEFKSRGNVFMIQSKLESLFNNIAVKLSYSNRPPYIPPEHLALSDLEVKLKQLQDMYQDKRSFLQNELNRQMRLAALNDQHKARAYKLVEWLSHKETWLQREENINSVGAAQMQIRQLDAFERESDKIYKTNFSSQLPDIEEEVKVLKTMFKSSPVYLQAEVQKAKHKRLVDELTERLFVEEEVKEEPPAEAAQEKQKPTYFVSSRATFTLRDQGLELVTERYEHAEEALSREKNIESRFLKLWELAKAKRPIFQAILERELVKEKLRVDLNRVSNEFLHWAKDTIDRVESDNSFGLMLSEADTAIAEKELNESDSDIITQISERYTEFSKVLHKLQEYGQEQASTFQSTTNELEAAKSKLETSLKGRRTRFNAEVQKQQDNDKLCKQFATSAEELFKWIVFEMEHVSNAQHNLTVQLETILSKISDLEIRKQVVTDLQNLTHQIDKAGVIYNPHTTLTFKDVLMQWEQYQEFLNQKKLTTEDEIMVTKHRGVTSDQIKEIHNSFELFDANKDGHIDKKELKKCLFSLGEEREMREVEKIIDDYGSKSQIGQIDLLRFEEFMVKIYGDSGAKDEILQSFELLSRGDSEIKPEHLETITKVMHPPDLEYFTSKAPRQDNIYNYKAFVEDMFSR